MVTSNGLRAIVISDPPDATAMCNANPLQKPRSSALSRIPIAILENKAIIGAMIIINGNAYIGMPKCP